MQTIIHIVVRIWQQPVFVDLKQTLYGDTRTNIPLPRTEEKILLCLYCAQWYITVCGGLQEPLNLSARSLSSTTRLNLHWRTFQGD